MKVGDLVQIRHNEHHGLFVISSIGINGAWSEILSLSTLKKSHELTRSLELINESG